MCNYYDFKKKIAYGYIAKCKNVPHGIYPWQSIYNPRLIDKLMFMSKHTSIDKKDT